VADGPERTVTSPESAGSSVHVRRLLQSDKGALREVRLRSLATDRMAFGETFEEIAQKDDRFWNTWAHVASTSGEAATFVAVDPEGSLVGLVGSRRIEGVVWLGAMWVAPPLRGHGIGARLLDALLAWAELEHPKLAVRLSVVPSQDAAVRLYRSRGFDFTGQVSPLNHAPGLNSYEMARPPRSSNT
jgi:GNAT superfamily N-acetyltransferase